MKIDAVILAGGPMDESLRDYSDAPNKGYIRIGDKLMMEYPIDAAAKVKGISRIVLVTNPSQLPDSVREKVEIVVEGGDSIASSLRAGAEALKPYPDRILVLPCDMTMITGDIIEEFLERSLNPPVDLTYAYLSRENSEAKYPDIHHTYVKLKDGVFCGTGLFTLSPEIVEKCERFFDKISKKRKDPIGIGWLLGLGIVFKFSLGILSVRDLEKKTEELLKCSARGIEITSAESGFNVDAPNELEIARRLFGD